MRNMILYNSMRWMIAKRDQDKQLFIEWLRIERANPSTYLYCLRLTSPSPSCRGGSYALEEPCWGSTLLSYFDHLLAWLATCIYNQHHYNSSQTHSDYIIAKVINYLTNRHHPDWRYARHHPWQSLIRLPYKECKDHRQPHMKSVPWREPKFIHI